MYTVSLEGKHCISMLGLYNISVKSVYSQKHVNEIEEGKHSVSSIPNSLPCLHSWGEVNYLFYSRSLLIYY